MSATPSREALETRLRPFHQEQVLQWWDDLTPSQRSELAKQIDLVDLAQLHTLVRDESVKAANQAPQAVSPAPVLRLPTAAPERLAEQRARDIGVAALRAGHVAILIVAGGQGTRLGFDGPKGAYPIGPVSGATLFQILCEKVEALRRRYGVNPPLLFMTSEENDAATRACFAEQRFFGLPAEDVIFFPQGSMPAVDAQTGKLLLAEKGRLATSPDGHGGLLAALARHRLLDVLAGRGLRYLFSCQVDNPLVRIADPTYVGQHIQANAEMSLKVVAKKGPKEAVGSLVLCDRRLQIIEYSELPKDLAERRDHAGNLAVWAGNTAIHIFSLPFLERLASDQKLLPYHRALKKVPFLDAKGQLVKPDEPIAFKFEKFIFDALPLAEHALAVETGRREEFEPLKNDKGEYSPESVRQAMSDLSADWLSQAGVEAPRRADGHAAVPIEISPLFADSAVELYRRAPQIDRVTGPRYLKGG